MPQLSLVVSAVGVIDGSALALRTLPGRRPKDGLIGRTAHQPRGRATVESRPCPGCSARSSHPGPVCTRTTYVPACEGSSASSPRNRPLRHDPPIIRCVMHWHEHLSIHCVGPSCPRAFPAPSTRNAHLHPGSCWHADNLSVSSPYPRHCAAPAHPTRPSTTPHPLRNPNGRTPAHPPFPFGDTCEFRIRCVSKHDVGSDHTVHAGHRHWRHTIAAQPRASRVESTRAIGHTAHCARTHAADQ